MTDKPTTLELPEATTDAIGKATLAALCELYDYLPVPRQIMMVFVGHFAEGCRQTCNNGVHDVDFIVEPLQDGLTMPTTLEAIREEYSRGLIGHFFTIKDAAGPLPVEQVCNWDELPEEKRTAMVEGGASLYRLFIEIDTTKELPGGA